MDLKHAAPGLSDHEEDDGEVVGPLQHDLHGLEPVSVTVSMTRRPRSLSHRRHRTLQTEL